MRTAASLLKAGGDVLNERAREYDRKDGPGGEPGERSAAAAVRAFNAITGRDLTESEGWLFLSVLKLVRLHTAPGPHDDSATDAAVYAALMGEAKYRAGGVKATGEQSPDPGVCPVTDTPKCPADACPPGCRVPGIDVDAEGQKIADGLRAMLTKQFGPDVRVFPVRFPVGAPAKPAEPEKPNGDGCHWLVWHPVNGYRSHSEKFTHDPEGRGMWSEDATRAVHFSSAADAVKEAKKWINAQVRSVPGGIKTGR